LSVARNFDFGARGFSKNLGLEYVHNFGVMAQVLLTGENRFLSPCDFKELRVIKRARFTTSTLAASQHSLNSITRTDRWESRKNLALCKLKLFRSAGQDNHRISDCADFIIRILGGADVVVLHLRPELQIILPRWYAGVTRSDRLVGRGDAPILSEGGGPDHPRTARPVVLSCWLWPQPPPSTARAV